jgi:uncharacterized membrane protein (DUF373 family)
MLKNSPTIDILNKAVILIEGFVAALLVLLAAWGAVSLVVETWSLFRGGPAFVLARYIAVLDIALLIFIIVELFRIAVAYLKHADVIPTVMEAALVAVARKLVTFDSHQDALTVLMKAGALTLLLLAVGLTWYLLAKRNPTLLDPEETKPA